MVTGGPGAAGRVWPDTERGRRAMQGSSQSRRTAHVVAATDGTAAGARAVRFGAEEAVRRDQHLEVVHVMPVAQTAALSSLRTVDDSLDRVAEQRAREVLAQAVAAARQH